MIDFSGSKENARMLIERFLETGEQPDFMEYLCFKEFYINANFYGYGVDYILENFQVYAGIIEVKSIEFCSESRIEELAKVEHCYSACDGVDVVKEAARYNVGFKVVNGKLSLAKIEERKDNRSNEYDRYSYYANRNSQATN